MTEQIRHPAVGEVFAYATRYLSANRPYMRLFWLVNFAFLALFQLIDEGFSNPISFVWLWAYYVFWCVFFRVYYNKKPYFSVSAIAGSIAPSTKMLFLTILATLLLVLLPYIPLLMGFNDRYLAFFEEYMEALKNIQADTLNQAILGLILLILSPWIICRPFFAWLAALQGFNGSMNKAFKKTRGNNIRFMWLMFLLDLPCLAIVPLDTMIGTHGWLTVGFYSIYFLWFNIVFARLYDFFYHD